MRWPLLFALFASVTALACESAERDDETETPVKETRKKKKKKKKKATGASSKPAPPPPTEPPPNFEHPALKQPPLANVKAPAVFAAQFETTKGPFQMTCTRAWAPHGVDRIYNLVKIGFFKDIGLFRIMPGFVAQFGIHGDPAVAKEWRNANLPIDPVKESNTKGIVSFAMAGQPTTRSTQLFINLGDNARLDGMGFAPICVVDKGMSVVESFHDGYGAKPSSDQARIQREGNAFLRSTYPLLDYITSAAIISEK